MLPKQTSPDAQSARRLGHLSSLKKLAAGRQNKAYKQSSGETKLVCCLHSSSMCIMCMIYMSSSLKELAAGRQNKVYKQSTGEAQHVHHAKYDMCCSRSCCWSWPLIMRIRLLCLH